MGCARLDAEVYPDSEVASFVTTSFVPVKVHVKEQPTTFSRFGVNWTPTLLVMSPDGIERHRIEGFLPGEDLLAQLTLALGHAARKRGRWAEAEEHYRRVLDRFPSTAAAPEALYWTGVSRYKVSGDHSALAEAAQQLKLRYPESEWMKKASVWGG